ncbi:MAG: hypothetical protein ACYDBJ_12050 [Aggregatilineales bacterium]
MGRLKRFQSVFRFLLPPALYMLAAILITWPIISQLSTYGLGAGYGDQFENVRLIWWTKDALQHGLNPFYQSLLGYPIGFFSAAQWAEPLGYWPAAILSFVVGPLVAYNVWMLIQLALNGWAAFALCREVLTSPPQSPSPLRGEGKVPLQNDSPSPARRERGSGGEGYFAALIGGLIFMAYPTMQGHVSGGHINVLALYGLPLYALCLWRIVRGNAGRWTIIGGGIALWVTAVGDTDQVIYTLFPVTLFFLGYRALFQRTAFWQRIVIGRLVVTFAIGGVLLIPFFAPLFTQLNAPSKSADLQETGWVTYSADPLAFASLSPFTPWGAGLAPVYTRTVLGTNTIEGTAYVGVIALVLCIIAIVARTSGLRPWLTVALGSALFSLGPFLKWGDQPVVYSLGNYKSYVTLPWAFFQTLPVLNASRTPGRFNLATGLALAVIAACGAQVLLTLLMRSKRFSARALRLILTSTLLVGIGVEYQLFFPAPTTPATIPPYFYELAKRPDVRAVFDIPWDNPLAAKDALYWQTAHQKPLIAGYVLRQTPVDPAQLAVLQAAATGTGFVPGPRLAASVSALAILNNAGADAIVAHLRYIRDEDEHGLESQLGPPVYRDDDVAVFILAKINQSPGFFGTRGADGQTLYVYAPADGDLTVSANTVSDDSKPELLSIDGQIAGLLNSRVWLTRGYHSLHVASNDNVSLALFSPFEPESGAQKIALGSSLTLQNVVVTQTNLALTVATSWHIDRPLGSDYHLFIHLVNANGTTVAQYDNQPGSGAYPTTQWAANQEWTETDDLPLTGITPGTYHLETGWYSYPDMQRIPVYANMPGARNDLIDLGAVTVGAIERF